MSLIRTVVFLAILIGASSTWAEESFAVVANTVISDASNRAGKNGCPAYNPDIQFHPLDDSLCLNGSDWQFVQVGKGAGLDVIIGKQPMPAARVDDAGDSSPNAGEGWTRCTVPGSIQTALIEAGRARQPWYYAGNIVDLCKATLEKESLFRRVFTVPREWSDRRIRLYVGAVDYRAVFFLNGLEIGRHEGHFERVVFDVSNNLKFGETNELTVLIEPFPESHGSVGPERNRSYRSQIMKNMLTDCTPPACPLGISDDVFLLATRQLTLDDLCVRTTLKEDFSTATSTLSLNVDSSVAMDAEAVWVIRPCNSSGPAVETRRRVTLVPGSQELTQTIQLDQPALWWPRGYGAQSLYEATVSLADMKGERLAAVRTTFGIRRIEVVANPGSRHTWLFVVNGRKVFLKGSNWVPMDPFYRATREGYARLLLQAAASNMNTLRWWGGGVPERPAFYELCDELGIMIYHDFPLANDNYDNEPMLGLLRTQGADFFRRRRNHPCIVAWNGGNEWFSPKANAVIEETARKQDPTRVYFLPCGKQPGEAHGPYNYVPQSHYRRMNALGMNAYTEFGCASMANLSTLQDSIPATELSDFDAPILGRPHPATDIPGRKAVYDCEGASWRFHNRWWVLPTGAADSNHGFSSPPVAGPFGKIDNLGKYIEASQFLSGEGLRYTIEELRRRMYLSSAAFIWQFNESWPNAAGNATVDWFGRPRFTHYFVSRAYEPVHASLRYDRIHWRPGDTFRAELWATSDLGKLLPDAEIRCEIYNDLGERVASSTRRATLESDASVRIESIQYPIPATYESYLLVLCSIHDTASGKAWSQNDYLFGAHASDTGYFSTLLKARPARLKASLVQATDDTADICVENTGSTPALFCRLNLTAPDDTVVTYSDNAFCLPPSGQRTVRIVTHSPGDGRWKADFAQVTVSAWNSQPEGVK